MYTLLDCRLVVDALEVVGELGHDDVGISRLGRRVVLRVVSPVQEVRDGAYLGNEDGLLGGDDETSLLAFTPNHLLRLSADGHELEPVERDTAG